MKDPDPDLRVVSGEHVEHVEPACSPERGMIIDQLLHLMRQTPTKTLITYLTVFAMHNTLDPDLGIAKDEEPEE